MSLYTLGQILEGRRALICARETDTVGHAIQQMLVNRVAQLPVVDESGRLRGMISQQGILSTYFYTNGADLLRIPLSHCQDAAVTLSIHTDLLAAIDQLRTRGVYAVVVTDEERPVGILTGRDMTHLFRSLFEGILLVEQIEVTLRECVVAAFPDPDTQREALLAAFDTSRQSKRLPAQDIGSLSFTKILNLIMAPENWRMLEPLLGPKTLFEPMMERVRLVRNEIAHFQGRPDLLELDTLRHAVLWLANRRTASTPQRKQAPTLLMPDVKLHPLREILGQRQPPLCIAEEASIHEALRLMTEHRYAQLPVVDLAGMLVGMVNQPAILSMYYYTNGDVSLFDLPLHHVLDPAATLPEADTFFQAVNLLTSPGIAAAVIVRDLQPIGILTGKDMTGIFRTLCESIILVERIEQTLRAHVATVFPTEDQLNAAAIATFGQDPENPQYAVRNPHRLSFGDRVMLIADDDNWSRFEPVLGPRVVFLHLMERVRQVRNELMHFRGQLEPLERDLLMRAQSWLAQRPLWPK